MKKTVGWIAAILLLGAGSAQAASLYNQDFSTDTAGWFPFGGSVTRDTDTATVIGSAYTNFGGYNFGAGSVPTVFQEFYTSLDIYLDLDGGWANDTRFDYTSAISSASGGHLRDFAFNAGFYNDGPASAPNRFIVSASNNTGRANSYPKNPGRNPIEIDESGWYTFEHHFYDDGGVLAVDMSIFDSSSSLVNTWTLSNAADLISLVGGNRYGWFANNEFPEGNIPLISGGLEIDNARLDTVAVVPLPGAAGLGLLGLGLVGVRRRFRKAA